MAFDGGFVPLWAVVFLALALGAPLRARPFLMTLMAVTVIASTMPALVRLFSSSPRPVEVLPAPDRRSRHAERVTADTPGRSFDEAHTTAMTANDSADLMRMDDDGGPQRARRKLR